MGIITKQELLGKHYNGDIIKGVVLLKEATRNITKKGNPFFSGTLTSEVDVQFKAWDNSYAFAMLQSSDLAGKVVNIQGSWDEYQGTFSIILDSVSICENDSINAMQFISTRYDLNAYWNGLMDLVYPLLSDNGKRIADETLFKNEEVSSLFKEAFAAKSHHDNCKGGLLAHTYKLCLNASLVLKQYPNIVEPDLLILGCLLHDIGKIKEMVMGVYQPCSKVTHRFLGVEMINKNLVVELYGEDWYYELVAILLQHHGEWGDPCKTVASRVVNLIDEYEANLMLLKQSIEESNNCGKVNIGGTYLTYPVKEM